MATVHDVATAVLERVSTVTAMKLEKLVYYCQGWHLARHGSTLFSEPFEAWRQGPVSPDLYQKHRGQYTVNSWPLGSASNLASQEIESVDWVVREYGQFSAVELSRMTHNELPWRAARGGLPDSTSSTERISTELMRVYFARQIADPEAAVTLAAANAALEGAELDDDWQDCLRDVAAGLVSADELIAKEIARIRGA